MFIQAFMGEIANDRAHEFDKPSEGKHFQLLNIKGKILN